MWKELKKFWYNFHKISRGKEKYHTEYWFSFFILEYSQSKRKIKLISQIKKYRSPACDTDIIVRLT